MRITWPVTLLALVSCGGNAGDGRDDSFGGSGAKQDGEFSTCQLAEVLKLVNESTSTTAKLEEIGLSEDAAKAIVAHRNGPDGDPGTGDDDIFDDLDELDRVDFVGKLALGQLVFAILPRCEVDLKDRPFIDDQTFTGAGGGFARNNEEVEVVLGVQGLTGQRLRSLLLQRDLAGRTLFSRLRRNRIVEAFTYGFPIDEIPWGADHQAAREQMPLVALTIESDRFAVNDEGERELSVGTDLMDDTYYDTHSYSLLSNGIQLRGRARWDNPTTIRRLLIAAKFGTEIDAEGNKTTQKIDIRNDGADATEIAALDTDVRRGKTSWGSDRPAEPVRGVYEQMKDKNLLLDIGANTGVLLLEPAAHLRSTRSRYHLNEASITAVENLFVNGETRIRNALNVLARARTANIIPAADKPAVDAMEAMANGILDRSLLIERINAAAPNLGVTAGNFKMPNEFPEPTSAAELDKHRVIAETINTVYHEFAAVLDDVDRIITNAVDEDFDDVVDMFRAWRVSLDNSMARKTSYDSFLASYRALSTAANKTKAMADFNAFGEAQRAANDNDFEDFVPLDEAAWDRLEGYIEKAVLTVGERMIETAGLTARMLWFDQARQFWVPNSSRAFSNLLIDTTDMTDMLSHQEWTSMSEPQRTFAEPLPAEKVFNTTFVNEVQIELGMEEDYVARLRELDTQIAADPDNTDLAAQLAGARFVWGQYTGAMKVIVALKGENILNRLRRAGAPQNITWAPPADSKGNIALRILSDRD
jgi:hypothetical protein